MFVIGSLAWCDVDPRGKRFDPERVRALAAAVLAAAPARLDGHDNPGDDELETKLMRAMLAEHGSWVAGWSWGTGEGGPVLAWCCPAHSLSGKSPEPVVTAVTEWHGLLVQLCDEFAALDRATAAMTLEQRTERAAARLLRLVLARTCAEEAWYLTFTQFLTWYLEWAGHQRRHIESAIDVVVKSRFESYVEPPEEVALATCAELGAEVARVARAEVPDQLAEWQRVRPHAFGHWMDWEPQGRVAGDAHRRYIETVDAARDPARGRAMLAALEACRASAQRGEALTFERLAEWQALVLGVREVSFRRGDAFARSGRERYALAADTEVRFRTALAQSNSTEPACLRAGRVYLDVCFYHPFDDGNARAARLALDHVLTRAGLGLHVAQPLFALARSAADRSGAYDMCHAVAYLSGPLR